MFQGDSKKRQYQENSRTTAQGGPNVLETGMSGVLGRDRKNRAGSMLRPL